MGPSPDFDFSPFCRSHLATATNLGPLFCIKSHTDVFPKFDDDCYFFRRFFQGWAWVARCILRFRMRQARQAARICIRHPSQDKQRRSKGDPGETQGRPRREPETKLHRRPGVFIVHSGAIVVFVETPLGALHATCKPHPRFKI